MGIVRKYKVGFLLSLVLTILALFVRRTALNPPYSWPTDIFLTFFLFGLLVSLWIFFSNINKLIDKWLPFEDNVTLRIVIQLGIGTLIIFSLRMLGLYVVDSKLPFEIHGPTKVMVIGLNFFLGLTLNLAIIASYLIKKWKNGLVQTEILEKEKAQLQLQFFKNQVNPHFLFNSFSVIQGLIRTNPTMADAYTGHLAKIYRYALTHQNKQFISLDEELEMFEHYINLLKIRYGNALSIVLEIDDVSRYKSVLLLTLQTLTDNAIKHNEIHVEKKLSIIFSIDENCLVVSNNLQPKTSLIESHQEGLKQMKSAYEIFGNPTFTYGIDNKHFIVRVPLLEELD